MLRRPYMLILKSMHVASISLVTSDHAPSCDNPSYEVLRSVEDSSAKCANVLVGMLRMD
jgi:hypothetical protein